MSKEAEHPKRRVVVLLSGGIDSLVCAEMARKADELIGCVFVDYGQPNQQFESWKAFRYCLSRGIKLHTIHALGICLGDMAGDGQAARVVPARNAILLSLAANYALSVGANQLLIGANAGDQSDYEDCRRTFFRSMFKALGIVVHAPLVTKQKPTIIAMAKRMGFTPEDAWSCYTAGPKPCHQCPSCIESDRAWGGREGAPEFTWVDISERAGKVTSCCGQDGRSFEAKGHPPSCFI